VGIGSTGERSGSLIGDNLSNFKISIFANMLILFVS